MYTLNILIATAVILILGLVIINLLEKGPSQYLNDIKEKNY